MWKGKDIIANSEELEETTDWLIEDSLEKDIDNHNTDSGKVQLVTKRFVKCMIDEIKYDGHTYKRWDEISMTEQDFGRLSKNWIRFEDL